MSQEFVEAGLRPSWTAPRITWHIRHSESIVLTARYHDTAIGFAVMRFGDEAAHLNLLAVEPVHRRRGVAKRMMTWLEETALTAGTFTIGLELRATNQTAFAFYLALGYQELGRVAGYYQGVEPAIRMARDVRTGRDAVPGLPQPAP
jgi:ribosomal-protein-alanine N-acetyltransferase